MKRILPLSAIILGLSVIAGTLLSKVSFVGRIGINLAYREYKFLKTWWKGAATIAVVLLIMLVIHELIYRRLAKTKANALFIAFLLAGLIGVYFTYDDFRHTTTHRWLGERFHIGGYLFWAGWLLISGFYLLQKKNTTFIK